jgi:Na+-translocating ferredoxin:NAD+ oxidoreductase RnfG subunit
MKDFNKRCDIYVDLLMVAENAFFSILSYRVVFLYSHETPGAGSGWKPCNDT